MLKMQKLVEGAQRLGLTLTPRQIERFQVYYDELVDWNRRMNLTAIVDYDEVQVKHFLDSLTVSAAFSDIPSTVVDVGTGAGLPGMALKIVHPEIALTLIDSVQKKALFLNYLVDVLKLDGVEIVTGRAEELAHDECYRERFDAVLARGVSKMAVLAELTLPFCAVGGVLIAMKKREDHGEVDAADAALRMMGGRLRRVVGIDLPELTDRALVVVDKVKSTPDKYPRRSGIPQKRPLLRKAEEFS
ncbi:MAG: 16S rRNA (guanine(527)-N(7))-methyltransferase RsmG [Dehalococcoidia bacterium]